MLPLSRMLKKYTKGFNKVVLFLTMADVFVWGPFFIISALSGIYLSQKLGTGTIEFVGVGTAIYFLTRAITQLPIGYITDKIKKDKDEIFLLICLYLHALPFLQPIQCHLPSPRPLIFLDLLFLWENIQHLLQTL